jgi:hypothetical protein
MKLGLRAAGACSASASTASEIETPDCKAETRESITSGQALSRSLITFSALCLFIMNGIEVDKAEIAIDICFELVSNNITKNVKNIEVQTSNKARIFTLLRLLPIRLPTSNLETLL